MCKENYNLFLSKHGGLMLLSQLGTPYIQRWQMTDGTHTPYNNVAPSTGKQINTIILCPHVSFSPAINHQKRRCKVRNKESCGVKYRQNLSDLYLLLYVCLHEAAGHQEFFGRPHAETYSQGATGMPAGIYNNTTATKSY